MQWLFLAKVPVWFLGGGVALMALEMTKLPHDPETWASQIGFDVITSFFLIAATTGVAVLSTDAHQHGVAKE